MNNNIKSEEKGLMNYESLISKLRTQDAEIIKKNKLMIVLSGLILISWVALCIYNYNYDLLMNDGVFDMLIFILLTLILIYRIFNARKHKLTNYADSVINTLNSAEKRYRFWNSKVIFESIIALILGVALGYFLYSQKAEIWPELKSILLSILTPVLILSFSMGRLYRDWKKEKRPLWISAKKLLKEFE